MKGIRMRATHLAQIARHEALHHRLQPWILISGRLSPQAAHSRGLAHETRLLPHHTCRLAHHASAEAGRLWSHAAHAPEARLLRHEARRPSTRVSSHLRSHTSTHTSSTERRRRCIEEGEVAGRKTGGLRSLLTWEAGLLRLQPESGLLRLLLLWVVVAALQLLLLLPVRLHGGCVVWCERGEEEG